MKAEMLVAEVLKSWPQTIPVFLRHKTACIGCSMAPFETLMDVSRNYEIPIGELLMELAESIANSVAFPPDKSTGPRSGAR